MKNVLLICLFFAGILSVDAQIAVGARAGANFAWWKANSTSSRNYESRLSPSPSFGAVLEIPFGGSLSLETGLHYSMRNIKYQPKLNYYTRYATNPTIDSNGVHTYTPIRDNLRPVGDNNPAVWAQYEDTNTSGNTIVRDVNEIYSDEVYSLRYIEIPFLLRYKTYGRFSGVYAQTGFMYARGLSATVRRTYTRIEGTNRVPVDRIFQDFDGLLPQSGQTNTSRPIQPNDIEEISVNNGRAEPIAFGGAAEPGPAHFRTDLAWVWGGGYYINVGLSGQILLDVRQAVGLVDVTYNKRGISGARVQRLNRQVNISVTYLYSL